MVILAIIMMVGVFFMVIVGSSYGDSDIGDNSGAGDGSVDGNENCGCENDGGNSIDIRDGGGGDGDNTGNNSDSAN